MNGGSGRVAQGIEHQPSKLRVAGSTPAALATTRMSIWRGFSRETEVEVEVEHMGCGAGRIICRECDPPAGLPGRRFLFARSPRTLPTRRFNIRIFPAWLEPAQRAHVTGAWNTA